jgi:hypothetical protein
MHATRLSLSNLCLSCLLASGLVWAASCDGGGSTEDGGLDAIGEDGADGGGDEQVGGAFVLQAPEDTQLCAQTSLVPPDYAAALQSKVQVALQPGEVRLPVEQDEAEVELIASVEVGPDGQAVIPTGPGVLSRSPTGALVDGDYTLTFRQPLQAGLTALEVVGTFTVTVQNGQPAVTRLDDALLTSGQQGFSVGRAEGSQTLVPCGLGPFGCTIHDLTLEGGDRVQFEACAFCPRAWLCKSSLGGLRRAMFDRTRVHRDTQDYFLLAHTWLHHDWGQHVLVVLEPAVGTTRAVALATAAYPDQDTFTTATYLDAAFQALETHAVTSQTRHDTW